MIQRCTDNDFQLMHAIINDASQAYKGVIPADRWKEPYMSQEELRHEISEGVEFWGSKFEGELVGVMGVQPLHEVTLIRHAYVRTKQRKQGIGGQLLLFILERITSPVLVGTWANAAWAIRFYEKYGFKRVSVEEKDRLLKKYWSIPNRQVKTSVVLANQKWIDGGITIYSEDLCQ